MAEEARMLADFRRSTEYRALPLSFLPTLLREQSQLVRLLTRLLVPMQARPPAADHRAQELIASAARLSCSRGHCYSLCSRQVQTWRPNRPWQRKQDCGGSSLFLLLFDSPRHEQPGMKEIGASAVTFRRIRGRSSTNQIGSLSNSRPSVRAVQPRSAPAAVSCSVDRRRPHAPSHPRPAASVLRPSRPCAGYDSQT